MGPEVLFALPIKWTARVVGTHDGVPKEKTCFTRMPIHAAMIFEWRPRRIPTVTSVHESISILAKRGGQAPP